MLYRELINFTPIESVKQLRASDQVEQAREDVRTFVISSQMREQLVGVVIPSLRFDNPEWDHKGLLLIATYGTGKTHLMSCIGAVAEHDSLAGELTDAETATAAADIAGQFKVVRVEIGAVQMGLRDIVATELTEGLKLMGVDYVFPALDKVTNNKTPLREMMAAFEATFPDKGLLLVIDELLDYLRTRKDSEIILDLGFLREMGEFCKDSRFRLIAGVQETLFDNPRFALAQEEVRRVRERYQSFRIAREDVAYVVQKRILSKSPEQKADIQAHLAKFAPAFESLAKDMDGFVEMFPVHPSYLRTFESLTIVEKRRVLSSLSDQIRLRLDSEVPTEEPGLICADAYRAELEADPSNKVIPEVREVLERTRVLRERVSRGMDVPADVPPALRIVDALAIHRLTTDDIEAPIGLTVQELRDDLCLLPKGTPELEPAFLANSIETLVREISKAVAGQFLSINDDNGQVYLDLKKDVDYEQQVDERAATLDQDALDAAYYRALETVLEVSTSPYVAGYRIWSYELPWIAHKVTRLGYLFMGAPNERSTAQPPRDFYIYFLQPYAPPKFTDDAKADEVFLRLDSPSGDFTTALSRYAAATQKALETTSQHKAAFEGRMNKHLTEMVTWLRANLTTHLHVTYLGERKSLGQWLAIASGNRQSLKEQLDTIASSALAAHFELRYPGYPVFRDEITAGNLHTNVTAALRFLGTQNSTAMARTVLESLKLLDIDGNVVDAGEYAAHLNATLAAAGGSAVNADALLVERDAGVRSWGPWHLEPAWLVVVAAALSYQGKAEMGFASGEKVGAQNIDALARMSQDEIERISFVAAPVATDAAALRGLAKLVAVTPGLIASPLPNDVVVQLVSKADEAARAASEAKSFVQSRPRLWGEEVFDEPDVRATRIDQYVAVLADAKARNTAGKMTRFAVDTQTLANATAGKDEVARVEKLRSLTNALMPLTRYLEAAANILGPSDPYAAEALTARTALRALLRAAVLDGAVATNVRQELDAQRITYRTFAVDRHTADRLTGAGDTLKTDLTASGSYRDLSLLSAIDMLPNGEFGKIETTLVNLVTCKQFTADVFDSDFTCPHCAYRPAPSSGPTARQRLDAASTQVDALWHTWVDSLRDSISAPEIATQVALLTPTLQDAVKPLSEGTLKPGDVTAELVEGVRQLLAKFDVVKITAAEVWKGVFTGASSLTAAECATRMNDWLNALITARPDASRVRIVPEENTL